MLYLILPAEICKAHITQTIAAPELDPVIHITPEDFPPLHCKNFLFPELVHRLEELMLIAEIMIIYH